VTLAMTSLLLQELFWCDPECACGCFNELGEMGAHSTVIP